LTVACRQEELLAAMSAESVESLLQTIGNPVSLARNSQIGPYVYPGYASEFTNWRDEQHTWREPAVSSTSRTT
jgi:vanillate/3-O-methylgallate O-demethylase